MTTYVIPQRRTPSAPPAQLGRSEVSEIDKKIAGIIKSCKNTEQLLRFAEHPTVDNKKASLNAENWALWFNKIKKSIDKHDFTPFAKISRITSKMLREIPNCYPGECAQITQAAGSLTLMHSGLANWIFENAKQHLHSFSAQEFYMLIDGARKLFNESVLQDLLESYAIMLNNYPDKREDFEEALKPQGIACLLKTCVRVNWQSDFSKLLFKAACNLKDIKLQEKVDLIKGLSLYAYEEEEARKILCHIENALAEMQNLPLDTLSIAMKHFADCGYIPEQLLKYVRSFLENSRTKVSDKISLLHSLAMLGITSDGFLTAFYGVMIFASQTIQDNKAFTKIFWGDLVRLLYTAAVFLSDHDILVPDHESFRHFGSRESSRG